VIRPLYDWTLRQAAKRHAMSVLAGVSFAESSVFPIPPDALIVPMILADRAKAWKVAAVATVFSVLGGLAGYAVGFFLYETVGLWVLETYGYADKFAEFSGLYNTWGAWIVFIAGVTPFPYKVITIASGVTALDPVTFIVASVLARGLRFFIEAALLWHFGPWIRDFIEKRLALMFTLGVVLLVGGFAALKLI
jgi:membrane protein YqaA with SNARE-associated domain